MQCGITDDLRKALGLASFASWAEYGAGDEVDPFFCWDAHVLDMIPNPSGPFVYVLLITNVSNRFSAVAGFEAQQDLNLLKKKIEELIRLAFDHEGFTREATDVYLKAAGPVAFGRTHGRRATGHMRHAMSCVYFAAKQYDSRNWFQEGLTTATNIYPCKCLSFEDESSAKRWCAHDLIRHGIERPLKDATSDIGDARPKDPASKTESRRRPIRPDELPGPGEEGCEVCGRRARILYDNLPFCASCYNRILEESLGLDHIDDEGIEIRVKRPDGTQSKFAVERLLLSNHARWSAYEIPTKKLVKEHPNYVGLEYSIYEPYDAKPEVSLKHLTAKVRTAFNSPSTTAFDEDDPNYGEYEWISAKERGWARIQRDPRSSDLCFVCDGIAYTGEEFLKLMSAHEGSDLHWEIRDTEQDYPSQTTDGKGGAAKA